MAGETKNQHYVPRSYLDRFSQGHSNRICVFNLCEDKILPRQLSRNYASRRFFYDVSKEELLILLKSELELFPEFVNHPSLDDPQYIEHILGKNEGDVKIIFDNTIANPDLIENKEYKLKVIIFFHVLGYRIEAFRNMAEDINEGVRDFISKTALPDNIKEKGYKQFSKEQAKMEQLSMMTSTKELVQTFSMLYYNYNWFFGTVYGREKLIVSDNPAKWIVLGLNDICFPISERNALILKLKKENSQMFTDDVPVGNIINLSDKSVVSYNMLQYVGANRYLFGDEKTLIRLRELYRKVYPDKKWTLPKMLHSI